MLGAIRNLFTGITKLNRGRKLGNKIAKSYLLDPRIFHSAIEIGGHPSHLVFLAQCDDSDLSMDSVMAGLLPFLSIGLKEMELKFGLQPGIEGAQKVVFAIMNPNEAMALLNEAHKANSNEM